jgi:signal transduction histidine kinase
MTMTEALRPTGIDVIGSIPWGTHFCHFYETENDLLSILVPYFKAGLENHEYCIWITSGHTTVEEAISVLMEAVPDLDKYIQQGCIEILSHKDWYLKDGRFELDNAISSITDRLRIALQKDFEGLRLNGDEAWLDRKEWRDFVTYESALNSAIAGKRLIISCTYRLDKCEAADVLDIAAVHESAIAKRKGKWEILEVSKLKKTKAQIQQENELLEHKVAERTRDLLQRNRDLEQFAYITSHNLRAPLANIIGLTQMLRQNNLPPDEKKELEQFLFQSIEKLDGVIHDLNHILEKRREVGKKKERVNLSELLSDVLAIFHQVIEQEQIRVITDFSQAYEIFTTKSYLYSVFYNLISNSIKYRQPDRQLLIQVRAIKEKGRLLLSFQDNGRGIDLNANGDDIFGLYKRFHPDIEGKGMGLYMVKSQVESLGGHISIRSQPGEGTTFLIELPVK